MSNICFHFSDKNIEKDIKKKNNKYFLNLDEDKIEIEKTLDIPIGESKKSMNSYFYLNVNYSNKKGKKLIHNVLDYFIENIVLFYVDQIYKINQLYNEDKDLYMMCNYCYLNYDKYKNKNKLKNKNWLYNAYIIFGLDHNPKIINIIKKIIKNDDYIRHGDVGLLLLEYDLSQIDFIIELCRRDEVDKNIIEFVENDIFMKVECEMDYIIDNYGIKLFESLDKNGLQTIYLRDHIEDNLFYYVEICLKKSQTEIIDHISKNRGNEKYTLDDSNLLVYLINDDNIESFTYAIENLNVQLDTISLMIRNSGDIIKKEYLKVLLDNDMLNLKSLKLLKKFIKKNPDKNLEKYVNKLIEKFGS